MLACTFTMNTILLMYLIPTIMDIVILQFFAKVSVNSKLVATALVVNAIAYGIRAVVAPQVVWSNQQGYFVLMLLIIPAKAFLYKLYACKKEKLKDVALWMLISFLVSNLIVKRALWFDCWDQGNELESIQD